MATAQQEKEKTIKARLFDSIKLKSDKVHYNEYSSDRERSKFASEDELRALGEVLFDILYR